MEGHFGTRTHFSSGRSLLYYGAVLYDAGGPECPPFSVSAHALPPQARGWAFAWL